MTSGYRVRRLQVCGIRHMVTGTSCMLILQNNCIFEFHGRGFGCALFLMQEISKLIRGCEDPRTWSVCRNRTCSILERNHPWEKTAPNIFVIRNVNIIPVIRQERKKTSTVCSVIVRFMCWGSGAAGTSGITRGESRTVPNVWYPMQKAAMNMWWAGFVRLLYWEVMGNRYREKRIYIV